MFLGVGWQVNIKITGPAECEEGNSKQEGKQPGRSTFLRGHSCNSFCSSSKRSMIAVIVLHFARLALCSGYSSF